MRHYRDCSQASKYAVKRLENKRIMNNSTKGFVPMVSQSSSLRMGAYFQVIQLVHANNEFGSSLLR